ncbi:MAG: hypothetical protein EXR10_06100 [Alphaproteobacteria bacterium]|nr:hypothetical protein [Alphaproteobacteria bacterium]
MSLKRIVVGNNSRAQGRKVGICIRVIAVNIGVQEYLDRLIQNGSHSRYNFIWQWRKHVMDENNPIIAHAHSDIAALPARQHVNYFATGTTLSSTLEK